MTALSSEKLHIIEADRTAFVEAGGTPEAYNQTLTALGDQAQLREDRMRDITTFAWLPELPEERAFALYDRMLDGERTHAAPNLRMADYDDGTATKEDDLVIIEGSDATRLLTAEHATNPVRKKTGVREGADTGTAGLTAVLAEDLDVPALILTGRQTSNAAVDLDHQLKHAVSGRVHNLGRFVSIHGMLPGKVLSVADDSEIHAIIGLGKQPNERSYAFAQKIKNHARDMLGLRITLGEERYMTFIDGVLNRNDEGQPATSILDARGAGSTVNFINNQPDAEVAQRLALQVETTRMLRFMPDDLEVRDLKSRVMGMYLGYCLLRDVIGLPE